MSKNWARNNVANATSCKTQNTYFITHRRINRLFLLLFTSFQDLYGALLEAESDELLTDINMFEVEKLILQIERQK